ncbi:MAG: cyclic nucleotide-binding domain-containing protein, partial [Desulfobacterales bacterium]|nr:cyclic nucleotide-binding domain-containing protein [Desulfobacterales bacterium]
LILIIFLTMAPLLGRIPLAVFAGIIMAVGLKLFDRSTLRLMRSLGNSLASRKDVAVSLLVNLSVAVITVSVNLVTAVIIGMAISMAYFVVKMSISIVRRQYAGNNVHSRRVRNFGQLQYLRQNGHHIRVVELHGPIFFGSADRLARQIEAESGPVTFCVLDMRHVNEIDGTGANILIQLYRNLKKDNKSLLISYVTENHPLWAFLDVIGVVNAIPGEHFFKDTDEALEWAEDRLLAGHYPADECRRYRLEELDALQGFSPAEVEALERRMDRQIFRKGDSVIREGHQDRDLLLLTRGAVSVKLHLPNSDRPRRLFTFGAGAMLGEMALLDGNPRSADVWAEADSELYRLPHKAFNALCRENPRIAAKLLRNIGRVLSHRLRERSEEVRLLEDV